AVLRRHVPGYGRTSSPDALPARARRFFPGRRPGRFSPWGTPRCFSSGKAGSLLCLPFKGRAGVGMVSARCAHTAVPILPAHNVPSVDKDWVDDARGRTIGEPQSPWPAMKLRTLPPNSVLPIIAAVLAIAGCRSDLAAAAGEPAAVSPAASPALAGFATPASGILAGGRITADDLPALRAAGIRHVIDLTPDAETPDFDEAEAVRAAGLTHHNLPIAGAADLDRDAVAAFDRLLGDVRGPTLVHCASGNRVGALAALRAAWLQGADEEAAIAEGRRWGLRSLETVVRNRLARERCVASAKDPDEAAACHGS